MSQKGSVNLCSTYVLPILGLNRYSFGQPDKFTNSYLSTDGLHIVVECKHPFTSIITNHANFKFELQKGSSYLAIFDIPRIYVQDIEKIRKGKYSQLSDQAKNLIRKKSGLMYRVPKPGGGFQSASELLALDKDPVLKKYQEERIGQKLPDDVELWDMPGEDNYLDLNLSSRLQETV